MASATLYDLLHQARRLKRPKHKGFWKSSRYANSRKVADPLIEAAPPRRLAPSSASRARGTGLPSGGLGLSGSGAGEEKGVWRSYPLHEQFEYCYRHGREEALEGTDLPEDAIPTPSPWSLEELLTEGWLPETHVSAGQ